jgi:hypothetical protein
MRRLSTLSNVNLEKSIDHLFNILLKSECYSADTYQNKLDDLIAYAENVENDTKPEVLYKLSITQALINYYLEDYNYAITNINNAKKIIDASKMEYNYYNTLIGIEDAINEQYEETIKSLKVNSARSAFIGSFVSAIGMLILGGIITGITYSIADDGGTYTVTTGLFLVGGILFVVSIYRFLVWLFYLATR